MAADDKERQLEEFYAKLGRAIAAWQLVETMLSQVYVAAIWPAIPQALMASFHAVQTFNGKLTLTDAAVRYVLKDPAQPLGEAWSNLWGRLQEKNDRRNHFAHYSVFTDFSKKVKNHRILLRPQVFDNREPKGKKPKSEYGANEILQITTRFFALAKETREFADRLGQISRLQRIEFS